VRGPPVSYFDSSTGWQVQSSEQDAPKSSHSKRQPRRYVPIPEVVERSPPRRKRFSTQIAENHATGNLPNLPTGESIALRSPPTLPSALPTFHSGTRGADIAAAAPRHWRVIYGWLGMLRRKVIMTSITYRRNIGAKVKTRQLFVPRVSIWLFRPGKQPSYLCGMTP